LDGSSEQGSHNLKTPKYEQRYNHIPEPAQVYFATRLDRLSGDLVQQGNGVRDQTCEGN